MKFRVTEAKRVKICGQSFLLIISPDFPEDMIMTIPPQHIQLTAEVDYEWMGDDNESDT